MEFKLWRPQLEQVDLLIEEVIVVSEIPKLQNIKTDLLLVLIYSAPQLISLTIKNFHHH